jgi:hypothetical protein
MRRLTFVLGALLAAGIGPIAQSDPPRSLTPKQAREDLLTLKRGLEEMHGGLYRFRTKGDLDTRYATMASTLDGPVPLVDFYRLVLEAAAWSGDGHMQVAESDAVNAEVAAAPLLPLRFLIEDERLVVLYNDSLSETIRPGMEVVSINGRSARAILETILPGLTHDGVIESRRKLTIGRSFGAFHWLFVDRAAAFRVTVRAPSGDEQVIELAGVRISERKPNATNNLLGEKLAALEGPRDNVHLTWIHGGSIARLRIRRFDGETFPADLAAAFSALRTRETSALILDIRGNPGGIDENGMLLLSHLVSTPFQYFERIHIRSVHPSFATWPADMVEGLRAGIRPDPAGGFLLTARRHPGLAETAPVAIPFLRPLYVLIDGGTFSSASDAAAHIRHLTSATFIGEETGGTYEGNTSGMSAELTLPHSRFRVQISLYGYYSRVAAPPVPGRGVLPDHCVPRRVSDVLAGRDAALEQAIGLARTQRT